MATQTIYPYGQNAELPTGYPIADDLVTNSAQKALSAAQGKKLNDRLTIVENANPQQSSVKIENGKQAYGTVGSGIQFGNINGCSCAYIPKTDVPAVVSMATDASANVSSYIQYVGANGKITSLGMKAYIKGNTYRVPLVFGSADVGVYVTFADDSFSIEYGIKAIKQGGFVDFGTMPSCLATDADNFLPAGVSASETDSNGNPAALVTYADVIAKYDALVSAYPAYAQKHSFGNDASDTIPMYYYTFKPKYYTQHVYLQAGVHGWEPDPVFALAEIMYLIANAYGGNLSPKIDDSKELTYLRGNVAFTVVPCVNPWGFNHRSDCAMDKRNYAQNNYDGVQLNSAWSGSAAEAVYVRTLLDAIASELSFAIDMHSTVWPTTRTKYGCFYGGFNSDGKNVRTIWRTYEWLYEFYGVKYPNIVNGDTCPNVIGNYASVGILTEGFHAWCHSRYGVQAGTMEFSDHVWSDDDSTNYPKPLHTSAAMSVAVNMYLNHILQQVYDGYRVIGETNVPSTDKLPTIG